ncbi:MAG: transpeptidase family protein [Deltaproteobacteria bacterium]|nr:transpeptidase family protein [Deltaproteobacteria bacterium]
MKGIDAGKTNTASRTRLFLAAAFIALLFAAIFARAVDLQVIQSTGLKLAAARQHNKTVSILPKRGEILDRNSKELAVSMEVDSVYADTRKVASPAETAHALSKLIKADRADIERKLKTGASFVWLKRQVDLSEEERDSLAGIDGIGMVKEGRRFYPNRTLAANLLGFTGMDANGLEGVELFYDNALKGAGRKLIGDKDAAGRVMLYEDAAKGADAAGMNVEMTVDKAIQHIAEKALKKAVEGSRAKGGTAVVMNPHTGEALAMASYPSYDPNTFGDYSHREWKNRAVTDTFEPGSILKTFLVAAALEENAVRTTELFYCENGRYRVADRVFHDAEKHGWLTTAQVIKVSSNICAAKIGERLGKARLYRYLSAFGFGEKTGIDLPGEPKGALQNYKNWSGVSLHTVSFGQGVSATSVQLVTALSAIANGGFLMKPYAVKTVRDSRGAIVSENNPVVRRRVISTETASRMTDMLIGVTTSGGTGTMAALADFEVAGKTATAQKPDLKEGGYLDKAFMAAFFGFVPAREPLIAAIVVLDEPQGDYHGGAVAAPAFREIASETLSYMGISPDRLGVKVKLVNYSPQNETKEGYALSKSAKDEGVMAMTVPDFTGLTMRAALMEAQKDAIEINAVGSGKAVSQTPKPGSPIPEDGVVTVRFQ